MKYLKGKSWAVPEQNIQNIIFFLILGHVTKKGIISASDAAKCYSVILDFAPGSNKQEQMTTIVSAGDRTEAKEGSVLSRNISLIFLHEWFS